MNLSIFNLLSESEALPNAVSALLISALGFAFIWFLNRTVTKMDRTIEKLELTMDGFVERLIKHDNRHDNAEKKSEILEKRIEKLEEFKKRRP
jgi:uncharacterized coiled-coil protein SlyX